MTRLGACCWVLLGAATVWACGGSSTNNPTTPGDDGGGGADGTTGGGDAQDNGSDATNGTDAGGGNDGPSSANEGGNQADASEAGSAAETGPADANAGGDGAPTDASDASPAPCPDVHGAYSITAVQGQGCGANFAASARECIRQGQVTACGINFQTKTSDAGTSGLAGDTTVGSDGSFSGAAITEGSLGRTGCTGTWDNATSTMRVDCGGVDSGQACVLDLVRSGGTCP